MFKPGHNILHCRLLWVLFLGYSLVLAANPAQASEHITGTALTNPMNHLLDHRGNTVDIKNYKNKYLLVYFGYTHCADVCPTGLQIISYAMQLLAEQARHVIPVFITLDPARDTTAILGEYVGFFHPAMVGMSGSEQEIKEIATVFGVRFYKAMPEKSQQYYIVYHTADTFLIDPKGNLLHKFPDTTLSDDMAMEIRKILAP